MQCYYLLDFLRTTNQQQRRSSRIKIDIGYRNMQIVNRKSKSVFLDKDLQTTLRKKAFIPRRRTYFELQQQQNERQHLQNLEYFKSFLISLAGQAVRNSTEHWNFVTSFQKYSQNTYQTAYKFMDLKQPQLGYSKINLTQEQQPRSLNIPLRIQINKLGRNQYASSIFSHLITDQTQMRNSKAQHKSYKKASERERERLTQQSNNSLIMLKECYRDNLRQQNDNESPIITQIRSSRIAIENMQKINQKNSSGASHFRRALSKSIDKLPDVYDRSTHAASKGSSFAYGPSLIKFKDFAFDSDGGMIKLKKRIENRLEKQQFMLDVSINYSKAQEISNFAKHLNDRIRKSVGKRANFSFREQQAIAKQNQIDGQRYRQNIMKSLHCKPGVQLKPKVMSKGLQQTSNELKLPKI